MYIFNFNLKKRWGVKSYRYDKSPSINISFFFLFAVGTCNFDPYVRKPVGGTQKSDRRHQNVSQQTCPYVNATYFCLPIDLKICQF